MSLPTTPNTSQGLFMTPLKTRVGGGGVVGGASSSRRRITTIIVNEQFGGGGDNSEEGGAGAALSHSEGDVHASASTHSLKSPTAAASRVSSGGVAGSHNNKGILNHNGRLSVVNPDIQPPHTVYTNSFGLTIAERQHMAASDANNYFASMGYGSPYPLQPCTEGAGATDATDGAEGSSQHIVVNSGLARSSNSSWVLNSSNNHAQQYQRGGGDGSRGGGGRLSHSSVLTTNNNTSLAGMEDLVNTHSNVLGSTSSTHTAHSTPQNNIQGDSATNVPSSQRKELAPLSTATATSPMRMPALMGGVGNPQRPLSSLSVSAFAGLSGLGGTDTRVEGKNSPLAITANNNNNVSRLGGTSLLLSPSAAALAAGGGVAGRSPSSLSTCSGHILRSSSQSHRRGLGVVRRGSPAFLPSDADAMSSSTGYNGDAVALRGTLLSNRSLRGALRSNRRGGGGAMSDKGNNKDDEEDDDSDIDGSPAKTQRQQQHKKNDAADDQTDDDDDDEGSISDLSRESYCSSGGDGGGGRSPNATGKGVAVTSSVGSNSGSALQVSRRINAIIQGANDDEDDDI